MSSFLSTRDRVEEGDTVIVYVNYGSCCAIKVKLGQTLNMKYGALRHEFLIGKPYGCRVSATAGYVHVLRPSPELWTRTVNRRTQILYTPDCALIAVLLDLHPGAVVAESGTGSGALTHWLARAVAPNGRVLSFDIEANRVRLVREELEAHGMATVTTVTGRNVCEQGFGVEATVDAIFLDLPSPWLALTYVKRALRCDVTCRLVSFSPCIEQVQRTSEMLRNTGFVQVETVELVPRCLKVVALVEDSLASLKQGRPLDDDSRPRRRNTTIPFPIQQPTHTGYLTSATLLPRQDEGACL